MPPPPTRRVLGFPLIQVQAGSGHRMEEEEEEAMSPGLISAMSAI